MARPVPGHSHLRYVGAAESPEQQQLSPTLLDRLERMAEALHARFDIFSGYRSDAYSAAHGGFAGDPHTRHIASDVNVGGRPLGEFVRSRVGDVVGYFARFGLRTGDQPGFYHGQPDPSHVDLVGYSGGSAGGQFSFTELQQLWISEGGARGKAALMAAIALAESGGDPNAVNPKSGATGLWQIHPGGDRYKDPRVNARTAISKLHSQGLGAWEAYTNGSYQQYLEAGAGSDPGAGWSRTRPGGDDGGDAQDELVLELFRHHGLGKPEGIFSGVFTTLGGLFHGVKDSGEAAMLMVKFLVALLQPRNFLRAVEFMVGVGLIGLGLVALLLNFLSKDELPAGTDTAARATRAARRVARRTPPVRALRGAREVRRGRSYERGQAEQERLRGEFKRGRAKQRSSQSKKRMRREGRRSQSGDIPF